MKAKKKTDQKGLYGKYIIHKADGSPVDPKAKYFVLRLDKDPHAQKAELAYYDSILHENPKLAIDIINWMNDVIKLPLESELTPDPKEIEHGIPFQCPECGELIQYGLSEKGYKLFAKSKLFNPPVIKDRSHEIIINDGMDD